MEPLRIFLADLTYNTVTLSTDAFPLNIGFVASYAKKNFGSEISIELFKYIDELESAIISNPPDVLGCSNYCWNERIGLEMFRLAVEKNPKTICISGGPNFPLDLNEQKKFLKNRPEIDTYVPIDGELGFTNILKFIIENKHNSEIKSLVHKQKIDGCMTIDSEGNLLYSIPSLRTSSLDDIPSPYSMGLMDKFFDDKLAPMIQTNRGCPFSCTFCTDGTTMVSKVNQFSTTRVREDIEYIGKHVTPSIHTLHISDLNFGMYPRDLETCSEIAKLIDEKNYPSYINTATGKNSQEKIIAAIKKLSGSLRLRMSVQSMDEDVLKNIKRSNISVEKMLGLAPAIKDAGLNTESEVILGLPGDTYEAHVKSLRDLVTAGVDHVESYTCMLLPGAEMSLPQERKKWGYKTKFRILPRDFVKLKNGKKILEIEEVIVASNTLSFDEYKEIRQLALIIFVNKIGIVYEPIIKFFTENDCDIFDVFLLMLKNKKTSNKKIVNIFDKFLDATLSELWDSPEDIEQNYQNDQEFEKLISGESGYNVIQYYFTQILLTSMNEWTEYFIECCKEILKEFLSNETKSKIFNQICNYCRGLSHNVLGENRMSTNPTYEFDFDMEKWLKKPNQQIEDFQLSKSVTYQFKFSNVQFEQLEDNLRIFGSSSIGWTSVVKNTQIHYLWRKPESVTPVLTSKQ